ncbi:glycosyltransferase family 8 protein [Beduini massiliensis]|uniref:glycosyltransferase family 8 protein n=1 Tax=Beduini massiliensis TaxID=1585974 RepID=UPI00059A8166|nr:glycosyltransferase family 8 protein [Beduini massiliensis]
MNILYTFNDKFVPQVGASICSVCENNKEIDEIHFYLLTYQLETKSKQFLAEFISNYSRRVTFISLADLNSYFTFEFDTLGWNPVILARLLIASLLPEEVNRILYLDGDTIIRGNLAGLWNTSMGSCVIGACVEPTVDIKRKIQLGLENAPYFNSGVLLINLNQWRKTNAGERIINFYKAGQGRLFAPDQDAINGALKNEIFILSPKYNFSNTFLYYPYRTIKRMMGKNIYISEACYQESKCDPCIIHYLGEERPWRKGNSHKYKNDFIYYLNLTPWKHTAMEDGWQLYFICWRIFNFCMTPFPMIRYKVINSLIPAFMRYRSNQLSKNNEK